MSKPENYSAIMRDCVTYHAPSKVSDIGTGRRGLVRNGCDGIRSMRSRTVHSKNGRCHTRTMSNAERALYGC